MSDLIDFAREHGILIDSIPPLGSWKRFPTEDHPNSRNGAVKYMGDHAFIQNHALMQEVKVWKGDQEMERGQLIDLAKKAEEKRQNGYRRAAGKATHILRSCKRELHPYLVKKGFPNQKGFVWHDLLIVPMRIGQNLCGCQMIDPLGSKRFLTGQQTGGAELVIDNRGRDFLVEGYATGLSLREALRALKIRYTIHICFSAGNMKKIATNLDNPFIVADHDPAGVNVYTSLNLPYWLSSVDGEDFNDFQMRVGIEESARQLSLDL